MTEVHSLLFLLQFPVFFSVLGNAVNLPISAVVAALFGRVASFCLKTVLYCHGFGSDEALRVQG
jgi:hypothetical protein